MDDGIFEELLMDTVVFSELFMKNAGESSLSVESRKVVIFSTFGIQTELCLGNRTLR